MPWTAKDAMEKNSSIKSPAQGKKWARIANGVLKACTAGKVPAGDGGCEATAIKIANTNIRRTAQAEAFVEQWGDTALQEAGRVLNRRHYLRIKEAINALKELLSDQDEKDYLRATGQLGAAMRTATKAVKEAYEDPTLDEDLSEAERSFDETRRLVQAALQADRQANPQAPYRYIRDLYDDTVIFESEGGDGTSLYRASYTIDPATTKVTLGEAAPVVERKEYVTATKAQESDRPEPLGDSSMDDFFEDGEFDEAYAPGSELVLLEEKALHPDGTVPIKIASPGWGTKGHYSREVLERDGPSAWPKGTQMYWNHPTVAEEADRPERDLRDLAAVTVKDPYYDENGPRGEGLYTAAKVFGSYAPAVDEMAEHIGVSLRAEGTVEWGEAEGREGPLVEAITKGKSIDFVTKAGRGGEVVSLFESARGGNFRRDVYAAPSSTPTAGGQEDRMGDQEQAAKNARLEEALAIRDARDYARELLSRAALPDITRDRLATQLSQRTIPLAEADGLRVLDRDKFKELVETAAKEEAAYLARLAGETGQPRDLAESATDPFSPGKPEPLDEAKVEEELAHLFGSIGLDEAEAKSAAAGRGW